MLVFNLTSTYIDCCLDVHRVDYERWSSKAGPLFSLVASLRLSRENGVGNHQNFYSIIISRLCIRAAFLEIQAGLSPKNHTLVEVESEETVIM